MHRSVVAARPTDHVVGQLLPLDLAATIGVDQRERELDQRVPVVAAVVVQRDDELPGQERSWRGP